MMLHFIFLFGFPVQPLDVKCVKHNKFGLTLKKITLKHIQWTFGLQYAINTTIYNLICGYQQNSPFNNTLTNHLYCNFSGFSFKQAK